ncbi:methylthioribose-1-phosphate isomerase [Leclercia adecarboxylata]|uniref:Methylthioribose-1-phosphate isomerase n=1 Tax=Leclercia adecarboxylata TaxID=83655 RepID=A0A4V6JIH2_9ENTR|nr:methylthioribose-1-phosphate isomerase [Leclercia adecarboxylata]
MPRRLTPWWGIFTPCACGGAPLIGLSASLLLALLAENGHNRDALAVALETLRAARPTAVNLMNNLDRMKQAFVAGGLCSGAGG